MMEYHQHHRCGDGSIAVRKEPGDPWTVIKGEGGSKAQTFANQQNKFWKPWMKDSIKHADDDENDTFSKIIRKPDNA